jgi:hypothetical protein
MAENVCCSHPEIPWSERLIEVLASGLLMAEDAT